MTNNIQFITQKQANYLTENYSDTNNDSLSGLFIVAENGGNYVAIDNSTGDCFVEEFDDLACAVAWLEGAFDISDIGYIEEGYLDNYASELVSHLNSTHEKENLVEEQTVIIIIGGLN